MIAVRAARADELDGLAELWYRGWLDAHASIVPETLVAARTLESFRARLAAALPRVRVAGDSALGLYIIDADELDQIYVAAAARERGVGTRLIEDAENRLAQSGVELAWLHCAAGNERAARFYERRGWTRAAVVSHEIQTPGCAITISVWRYEKRLEPTRTGGAR
jgi:ribosomal protein S18 acetylase RimI-like enzyme